MELFGGLHIGARACTLHFPVTLGRMNLAHHWNVLDGYALKDTHVNKLQRKKDSPVNGVTEEILESYVLKDMRVTEESLIGYALKDTPINGLQRKVSKVTR